MFRGYRKKLATLACVSLLLLTLTSCKHDEPEPDQVPTVTAETTTAPAAGATPDPTTSPEPVSPTQTPDPDDPNGDVVAGYYTAAWVGDVDLRTSAVTDLGVYLYLAEDNTGELCMGNVGDGMTITLTYDESYIYPESDEPIPFVYDSKEQTISFDIQDGIYFTFQLDVDYTETPEISSSSMITAFDPLVVDNDILSIEVLSEAVVDGDYMWMARVVNNSDKHLYILPAACSINGCMVEPSLWCELDAGESADTSFIWRADDMARYGIKDVSVIDMTLSVLDADRLENAVDDIRVVVYPNGAKNAEYVEFHQTSEWELLCGNDAVSVYGGDVRYDSDGARLSIIVQNHINDRILVRVPSVWMNGEKYISSWSQQVAANSTAYIDLPLDGIDTVEGNESIDVQFIVYTMADIEDVENIVLLDETASAWTGPGD